MSESMILKSTVVLAAALLARLALRRTSAATRHLLLAAAFCALLALPLLVFTVPALQIPIAIAPAFSIAATATAAPAHTAHSALPAQPAPSLPSTALPWPSILLAVWLCGTAAVAVSTAWAFNAAARLRRSARPLDDPAAARLAQSIGLRAPVDIREMASGQVPFTFGLLRPVILMPACARDWDSSRREAVLLHEMAHIQRGDGWVLMAARAAAALYWWNPLVWMALAALRDERERAADDAVLNAGAAPVEYAAHLLEIARDFSAAPAAGLAVVRPSGLERRLASILDSTVARTRPTRAAAVCVVAALACLLLPLAAVRAQQAEPAGLDDTIRAATSQKNFEMLDNAAAAAMAQSKFETAKKLLQTALEIRRQSGDSSPEFGIGLRNLADFSRAQAQCDDATPLYERALVALGDRPDAASAYIGLGLCALSAKDNAAAANFFERAQAADPNHPGKALAWQAIARQRQGDPVGEEDLYKRAVATDPGEPFAAELYALFLKRHGRADEATQLKPPPAAVARPKLLPGVYRMGSGISAPRLVSRVEPQYTEEARLARLEGVAVYSIEIQPNGMPANIQMLRGVGLGLDQEGIRAILQWRFEPGTKDGTPVPVQAQIEVNWKLM